MWNIVLACVALNARVQITGTHPRLFCSWSLIPGNETKYQESKNCGMCSGRTQCMPLLGEVQGNPGKQRPNGACKDDDLRVLRDGDLHCGSIRSGHAGRGRI